MHEKINTALKARVSACAVAFLKPGITDECRCLHPLPAAARAAGSIDLAARIPLPWCFLVYTICRSCVHIPRFLEIKLLVRGDFTVLRLFNRRTPLFTMGSCEVFFFLGFFFFCVYSSYFGLHG